MQPKMSKVRSEAVHGTEVAEKKASAMNMCGSLSHVMAVQHLLIAGLLVSLR